MLRWLLLLALVCSAVLATPLLGNVEERENLQYREQMAERRADERYLTNAQRIQRGLPLNRPHVRATRTIAARDPILSPSPRAAAIAVYRDEARTNLVGYVSAPATTTVFPVDPSLANAKYFTLPNQGPTSANTVNTGRTDRPFLSSAYGTGYEPNANSNGQQRLVSSGTNYVQFYASAVNDNGDPRTLVTSPTRAETSNWGIPDGTYGPFTYTFVDTDGSVSTPNFYYKSQVSFNLRAALNPTTASQNPRLSGNAYTDSDRVYLSWVVPPPPPPP